MATSIDTPAGSWAVVPMGHLDQPLNTFWQLFFRPRGAAGWTDQASGLAVATNGGLILSATAGQALAVGIRPASLLAFSPLLETSDAGRSWSPAAPIVALADQPDALAIDQAGQGLALTENAHGGAVLASSTGLASWHTLTTANVLAASPAGRSCGLVSMTAVGYVVGQALVGASCRRAGVVGLYEYSEGRWRLVGPQLPISIEHGNVNVLGLQRTTAGTLAVLAVSEGQRTSLVSAWTGDERLDWQLSPVLAIGSRHVQSFGPAGASGLFVLTSRPAASDAVEILSGSGTAWHALPPAPARTATLVVGPAGGVDALAVDDTTFTDWTLAPGSVDWTRTQVLNVPIQFGSSS
jgi:hypothetical protein